MRTHFYHTKYPKASADSLKTNEQHYLFNFIDFKPFLLHGAFLVHFSALNSSICWRAQNVNNYLKPDWNHINHITLWHRDIWPDSVTCLYPWPFSKPAYQHANSSCVFLPLMCSPTMQFRLIFELWNMNKGMHGKQKTLKSFLSQLWNQSSLFNSNRQNLTKK